VAPFGHVQAIYHKASTTRHLTSSVSQRHVCLLSLNVICLSSVLCLSIACHLLSLACHLLSRSAIILYQLSLISHHHLSSRMYYVMYYVSSVSQSAIILCRVSLNNYHLFHLFLNVYHTSERLCVSCVSHVCLTHLTSFMCV